MEKNCAACNVTKPITDFYSNKGHKDGLSSYCRDCHNAKVSAAYVRHPRKRQPEGMKRCPKCATVKSKEEFGKNKTAHDGFQTYCKKCASQATMASYRKDPTSHRFHAGKWFHKSELNKLRHYENSVRNRVGKHVEHGTYATLLEAQQGKCAICGSTDPGSSFIKRFHLDHCHTSGKVRGLLCNHCNRLLGGAKDQTSVLRAAIAYLEATQPNEAEKLDDDSMRAKNIVFNKMVP